MDLGASIPVSIPYALNATFGSLLVIVLILITYIRRYTADYLQRGIFICLLVSFLFSMLSDFAFILFEGVPGNNVYILLNILCIIYYIMQMLAFYFVVIFVDYMVFRSPVRSRKIIALTCVMFSINALMLFFNYKNGFYFVIIPESNTFLHGSRYYIRLVFGFLPLVFALGEFLFYHSSFEKPHVMMFFSLLFLLTSSSVLDLVNITDHLVWPCGAAALLYCYFFLVQTDTRIDALTGIGNRFSFNEFTENLTRRHSGESLAIVMLDMDHFKTINDTLGHHEGDNALRDMAVIIKSNIRKENFAARFGGDEFVFTIKAEKGDINAVAKVMNRIQADVDKHNAAGIRPFKLEISYGYDVFTRDGGRTMEEFLCHIDHLMYKHKQEHRRSSDVEGKTT